MWYRKNLPNWERALRVAAGLAVVLVWRVVLGRTLGDVAGVAVAAAAAFVAATGFVGVCPACAMLGRRWRDAERPT